MKSVIFMIGAALMSCNDRASHSLTPADNVASFTVETTIQEADRILGQVAERAGDTLARHPHPEANAIPHAYISTIATRRCMIFAEGDSTGSSIQLSVSLRVVRGKTCESDILGAFEQAKLQFEKAHRQVISNQ